MQISHTSENTEWVFLNIPDTCLRALVIRDMKEKEMVSEFHISPPSMWLDWNAAAVFFHEAHSSRCAFKASVFFQLKSEMEFPKACYGHPMDG